MLKFINIVSQLNHYFQHVSKWGKDFPLLCTVKNSNQRLEVCIEVYVNFAVQIVHCLEVVLYIALTQSWVEVLLVSLYLF